MQADVVYPIGPKSAWDDYNELKYSIRSVVENFRDLRDIYIIGHRPAWLVNPAKGPHRLVHVPHPDPYGSNKDANIITKVLRACLEKDLTEMFVRCSDDQLFLKPIRTTDLKDPWYVEDLSKLTGWGTSKWARRMRSTYEMLSARALPTYNCDAHLPALISKEHFAKKMLEYNYGEGNGYCINTLYFNSFIGYQPRLVTPQVKAGFFGTEAPFITNQLFLNYNNKGLTDPLKRWIKKRFPQKSAFEN